MLSIYTHFNQHSHIVLSMVKLIGTRNLFMFVCTIFSHVILGWCHEILGWKFIMIFLSFLWNLFLGKLRLKKAICSFFTYYHNKSSSQNKVWKYPPDDMKRFKMLSYAGRKSNDFNFRLWCHLSQVQRLECCTKTLLKTSLKRFFFWSLVPIV